MVARSISLVVLALLSTAAFAQTVHTFTFGTSSFDANGCAVFDTIDGLPSNQQVGFDGSVCVPYNENPWWGLIAPQEGPDGLYSDGWGYPNNGFLTNNNVEAGLGAPTFTDPNCNLTTPGCVFYKTGHSDFVGYGAGVKVDVTVWFKTVLWRDRYNRYHCCRTPETNGSGTSSYTPPQ
jgi:hypothetical protein